MTFKNANSKSKSAKKVKDAKSAKNSTPSVVAPFPPLCLCCRIEMKKQPNCSDRGRPAVSLSDRDRDIIEFFYANPDLTPRQLADALLLPPGELSRLLRLKAGRELINDLIAQFCPADLWPEYRLRFETHKPQPLKPTHSPSLADEALAEFGFARPKLKD